MEVVKFTKFSPRLREKHHMIYGSKFTVSERKPRNKILLLISHLPVGLVVVGVTVFVVTVVALSVALVVVVSTDVEVGVVSVVVVSTIDNEVITAKQHQHTVTLCT